MGVQNRSQMTSHRNGNHSKTSLSLSLSLCLSGWERGGGEEQRGGERERTQARALKLYFTRIVLLVQSKTRLTTSPCEAADEQI